MLHKLKTKSGAIVEVNEVSLAHALKLGWEPVDEPKPKPVKRRAKRGNSTKSS